MEAAGGFTTAGGPLVELALTLARQVDETGSGGPGTRLAGTYLTAIRTLMTHLGPQIDETPGSSTLARLRADAQARKDAGRARRGSAA